MLGISFGDTNNDDYDDATIGIKEIELLSNVNISNNCYYVIDIKTIGKNVYCKTQS